MDYEEAWLYLDNLQFFKIKLGLDSMQAFLDGVDHPQRNLKFLHVAGTNGKGSVSVTLLTLLSEAGYKVGLYTSPHLSSVRERFRINDRFISKTDFARYSTHIRNSLGERQITYFEFTTALALLWFAAESVDIAILEVGLGGRLDATNVITPFVSVITNVSMDHEAHLGNTLTQVASEKAGIIKSGVPVVSGVAYDESFDVVSEICLERGAPLYLLGRDFHVKRHDDRSWDYEGVSGKKRQSLPPPMKGSYQYDNTAMALAVLDCLEGCDFRIEDDTLHKALPKVRWPGRLEYFCRNGSTGESFHCPADDLSGQEHSTFRYLLDGAHNPAGIASLIASLENDFTYKRLICIWASMSDKDIRKTLLPLAPLCHSIIFTRPEEERSATTQVLYDLLPDELQQRAICCNRVKDALVQAEKEAEVDDLICIAGSLYLVGAARMILLGEIVE